jgi:hypothetical protein
VYHQTDVPLIQIRGRSQNVERGLCPSGTRRSKDKAKTIHHYIDQDGDDFVCIQESGIRLDTCPPALSSIFSSTGHHIVVGGAHSAHSSDTVAIAVHKQWKVARVFRLPGSSRCLAVELRQGSCIIFVASVYLPSNLDLIPLTTDDWGMKQSRAEARRILAAVERWSCPYSVAILCGDMNCTVNRTLDRKDDGSGPRAGNLLVETVLSTNAPFSDLFRELYPLEKGWTRRDARLDYVLLKAPGDVERVNCLVDGGFPSDHEGVCLEIHAPGDSLAASSPWTRPALRVSRSSLSQRSDFTRLANQAISGVLRDWVSRLALATTDAARLTLLEWGQSSLADAITVSAMEAFPPPGPRAPDYRQQYYRCRITALRRMAKRVRKVADGAISRSHWMGTSNSHEKKLRHVGLHPGFPLNDVAAWMEWAHCANEKADHFMGVLAEINLVLSEGGAPSSFPERLWSQNRGKKSFFDKYFRPSCGPIESAITPDSTINGKGVPGAGERTWDPRVYMNLVRTAVMKPFSTKVRLDDHNWCRPSLCSSKCQALPGNCKVPGCKMQPVACGDIRCAGRPSWWDYWYGPDARVAGAKSAFAPVAAAVTPGEVVTTIKKCDGGKSPGPDGVSIDLLKLLVGDDLGPGRPTTPADEVPLACLMAELTSLSIKLGRMTRHITDGLIVMVPKGPIDGPPDVSEMRPITLLSEIGKIPARILADRISAILCAKPELLNISQRAFLRNGDVSQCIATLLDVFEDHLAKKARDPSSQLFCVSYDLSKAYDSVQEYSIRASLERFEFPPEIVDYVCSSLWGSQSRVRTRDGPTEAFDVLSCVRQGDPLAPLVFILVLDVLHCGLEEICSRDGHGVELASGPCLASMGYADDTAIVADTDKGIRALHEWVRSFFGAHAFKINAKKTKFVSSVDPAQVRCLPGVDGTSHIAALPSDFTFRYLGVLLNMECTWKEELARLEKLMWFVRGRILQFRIPLAPAVDAINTFLVPKMEVGLGLIPLTRKVIKGLDNWTNTLVDAALNASAPQRITGVSRDGFCSVTDMANLAMMADCFRMGLAFERLNIRGMVVTPTARARFLRREHEPVGSINRVLHVPELARMEIRRNPYYSDPDLPIAPFAEPALTGTPVTMVHAEDRAWDPQDKVTMFTTPTPMTLTAFPDGSSVPGSRRCGGYSSIIFDDSGQRVAIGGHCKPSGMNYLSEITAILATLLSCPAQAHIDTWTDCLSAIQAIGRDDSAERARIRAAARPVLTCIRRAIRCRDRLGARTSFQHVRSHTNGDSFEAKGNALADVRANSERVEALHYKSVPFLTGEEMFTAWIPDTRGRMTHVIGDVRKALKRSVKRRIMHQWCALPHQGLTPKTNPDGAALLCKLARGQSSSELLRFTVLALCQWLPAGRYRGRQRREDKARSGRWSCPSCPFAGHETSRHAILCPVRRGYLLDAADRAHSLAMEAAEATLGETTTLPQDHARCTFRLLRHECRPGVAVNALSSLCRSGPVHDPHQALLRLCRSSAAPCSCHSGTCHVHGWRPAVGVSAELCARMALETDLFARPGRVSPGLLQWYSLDPEGSLMGSSGSPWDCTWGGMFALCAPCLSPGAGPSVMDRILVKAHQAVSGPRPTRIVLLMDRSLPVAVAPLEYELVGGAKVVIIENAAATALSPSTHTGRMPQAMPMRWSGPASSPLLRSPLVPSWHPLAAATTPAWLPGACRETMDAFRAFAAHDEYASSIGVPAKNFALVLACHMDDRERPSARARSAADRAVPVAMLALLKGAHKAWSHSCECRRAWWRQMDDGVMDSEIELRQLRLHQRSQSLLKRKYERLTTRKAAKRRRIAHLHTIADRLGMTRQALVAWRPDCLEAIPADLAALAPPPPAPSWSGTLRANPPSARVSLCDDYVGDDRTHRRLPFRSLRRERAIIARKYGR